MKKIAVCMATMLLLLIVLQPVSSWAASSGNWFNRFGSSIVTHSDSSWQSQKQGHWAGGGFSIRVPVDRTPMFNITPPRISAGCGGLDVFWGGFSFLNPEYLIQKMKNVMQAAPGYAFRLALSQLCTTCANILDSLEAIANELNALTMDDCKATQALVNAGGSFLTNALSVGASTGDNTGTAGDFLNEMSSNLSSWMQSASGGISKFRSVVNKMVDYKYCQGSTSHSDLTKCRALFTPSGSLWEKAKLLSEERGDDYKIDDKTITLLRALYGDVVFKAPDEVAKKGSDNSARQGEIKKLPACDQTLETMLSILTATDVSRETDSKIQVYDAKNETCVEVKYTDVLTESYLFGEKSKKAIDNIKKAMATNEELAAGTIQVINQSTVPIYTLLNIMNLRRGVSYGVDIAEDEMLANLLASSHALYILEVMNHRAMEVMNQARVFYAEVGENGPYNLQQASQALNTMDSSMEYIRYRLIQKIEEARQKYQQNMDGIVKYLAMRQAYRTIVATDLAGR